MLETPLLFPKNLQHSSLLWRTLFRACLFPVQNPKKPAIWRKTLPQLRNLKPSFFESGAGVSSIHPGFSVTSPSRPHLNDPQTPQLAQDFHPSHWSRNPGDRRKENNRPFSSASRSGRFEQRQDQPLERLRLRALARLVAVGVDSPN